MSVEKALILDFGGVVTRTMFETHDITERALGLPSGTLTWRGPFDTATDPLWRSMQADIYNVPLTQTNSQEGCAYGAALLAGAGTGLWKSVEEACRATIKVADSTKPDKKRAAIYARYFAVYQKLYRDLKDRFSELATLT